MNTSLRDREFLNTLEHIVEANHNRDDFGVQELAKKLHLSRSQLHRKTIQATGMSASAYINEYRIKKALLLLQSGKLTVSEVAFEVGFSSASYFSTVFKKHYSISPKQVQTQESSLTDSDPRPTNPRTAGSEIQQLRADNKQLWRKPLVLIVAIAVSIALIFGWKLSSSRSDTNSKDLKEKSIAVLPFRNYSNDTSMEVFCYGMSDELISRLSKLENFDRVISRTSAFKFKDMQMSIPEIASELEVSYILEGNLQKSEEQIKVNVQLIDASTDDHIWTEQYTGDWQPNDIFKIQEQITSSVADHMSVVILSDESEVIRKIPSSNKDAYNLYLHAKFHMYSSDEESLENARQMLEECIELDSAFADAYTELGFIWLVSGLVEGIRDQDIAWQKARYYLSKAQLLDPSLTKTEFHLLQGYFYFDWDFTRLEDFYHTKFSKYTYDRESSGMIDYAIKTSRFESALAVTNNSIDADPLDASLVSFKARTLWFLGRKDEAMELLKKLDGLNKNDWFYLREAAHTYFIMKEYERSRELLDLVMDRFEDRSPLLIWLKLFYSHRDGDLEEVEALFDELETAYQNGASGSPAWFIALYQLSIQEDIDLAFEWLEKSYEAREVELTWLKQEPLLEPLRQDERYESLYRRIGFDKLKKQ